jgi:hypothetical protein
MRVKMHMKFWLKCTVLHDVFHVYEVEWIDRKIDI